MIGGVDLRVGLCEGIGIMREIEITGAHIVSRDRLKRSVCSFGSVGYESGLMWHRSAEPRETHGIDLDLLIGNHLDLDES